MHVGLALPFRFDAERLKADLALIRPDEWTPHYNQNDFGGDWRGVALRSPSGHMTNLTAPFTAAAAFLDTPLMTRCAYFRDTVAAFPCALKSVRLLSLAGGSFIREHVDNALDYEDGEMRIHIPVQTSADVEFYIAGERLKLEEGSSYYLNVNLPHRITNRGSAERVHLIIDVEVNEWVHTLVHEARERQSKIPRIPPPPRGFDDFAGVVMGDAELRDSLLGISDRSEFVDATVRQARERGFDVIQPDVEAALHVTMENGTAVRRVPRPQSGQNKVGWMPIEVHWRDGKPFVEWIYTGTRRFTEPYFTQTIQSCLRDPFRVAFRQESRLDCEDDCEVARDALAPSGFIFHSSRCGSTLVSQMLASLPSTVVISEAPVVDQVLQAHLRVEGLSVEEQAKWFGRIVRALGQRRSGMETHLFVKFDSWHIHRLPWLRAAFPDTPLLFLFRDPMQIMLSHATTPGMHCLPGAMPDPRVLGLTSEDIGRLSREEWCAQVVARIWSAALAWRDDPKMLFVNYEDLPAAVFGPIAQHFSLAVNAAESALMRAPTNCDAKRGVPWSPERERALEGRATGLMQELCAAQLAPLYAELQPLASASCYCGDMR